LQLTTTKRDERSIDGEKYLVGGGSARLLGTKLLCQSAHSIDTTSDSEQQTQL
jgi:hypothetical protein